MDNLNDLILAGDYFLFFAYAILAYYFLKLVVFKKADAGFKRIMAFFFLFKVVCTLMMSLLLVYYWGVSDNMGFFAESKNFVKLIKIDGSNIKYFFLPVEAYNDKIQFDNTLTASWNSVGIESNFLVTKFSTLLYPLALGRYIIINLLFSVIATVAQLKFYSVLATRYPHIRKAIAIGTLYMPSILLYSSYMTKETLCVAFIGFAFYNLFQLVNKKKMALNLFFLLLNILLIGIVKIYVLATIGLALLLVFFIKGVMHFWRGSIVSKIFTVGFLIVIAWVFFSNLDFFDPYIVYFADASNTFQEQYKSQELSSSFEFGEVETSFAGLLMKAPLGIYTTYFRPHLWEVNKPIILFSALESFFVLILTFWALFSKRKYIGQLMRTDLFANFSAWFVLLFGIVVGLTTFNFGTLIRYKIPAMPFLMVFVFLLINSGTKKTEVSLKK